jgi:hypothetical protein
MAIMSTPMIQTSPGGGGGAGATDHGALTGLTDDDHSQYVHITTARTIDAVHTFNPGSATAWCILGANATGQLITGLNADELDGLSSADFATAIHTHATTDVTSGTFADARISESSVTQHQAAMLTLAENVPVILDPALSADGKYSGITEDGTAGATLAFGDVVYLAAADSRWELTDASAAATSGSVKVGICVLAAAADGDPTTVLLYGNVRADTAFPALTISAPVYISETAGDVVVAQPTTTDAVIRVLGFANTADSMHFCPSPDFITHV